MLLFGIGAVVGIFLMLFQAFGTTREALLVMLNLPLALIGGVIAMIEKPDIDVEGLLRTKTDYRDKDRIDREALTRLLGELRREGREK